MTATLLYQTVLLPPAHRPPVVTVVLHLDGRPVSSGVGQTEALARLAAVNDYCDDVRRAVEESIRAER